MITVTEIKDEVRVHTGVSKVNKQQVEALSKATKIPQSVVFNSALEIGLAQLTKTVKMKK